MAKDQVPPENTPVEDVEINDHRMAGAEAAPGDEEDDDDEDDEDEELPSPLSLLLDVGLYKEYELAGDHFYVKRLFEGPELQFDAHCVYCARESTFKQRVGSRGSGAGSSPRKDDHWLKDVVFDLDFQCQRKSKHIYHYIIQVHRQAISKIGQSPSLASIATATSARFIKVLDKPHLRDLNRATGLFAHGVGAGSFVYLRRIFEHLLLEAAATADIDGGPVEAFDAMHMDEKVKALASVLPEEVVETAGTYAVLSAGIHALSEEECLSLFPVMRASIESILDGHIAARARAKHRLELKRAVADAASAIKAKGRSETKS